MEYLKKVLFLYLFSFFMNMALIDCQSDFQKFSYVFCLFQTLILFLGGSTWQDEENSDDEEEGRDSEDKVGVQFG